MKEFDLNQSDCEHLLKSTLDNESFTLESIPLFLGGFIIEI